MMTHQPTKQPAPQACPICRKTVAQQAATFPFCSERCKSVDLGRWAKGDYIISRPINKSDLDEV